MRLTFDKSWFPERDKSDRSQSVGYSDSGQEKGVTHIPRDSPNSCLSSLVGCGFSLKKSLSCCDCGPFGLSLLLSGMLFGVAGDGSGKISGRCRG